MAERFRYSTIEDMATAAVPRLHVLPFEIVSVLLLAAVIGGVYLAKREPGGPS